MCGADEGKRSRATRLPQFAIGESRMLCSICFLLCSLDFRFAHPAAGGAHLRPEQDKAQGQKNRCNDAFTFGISITPGRSSARTYWAWCSALRSLRREGRLALHDGGHAQEEADLIDREVAATYLHGRRQPCRSPFFHTNSIPARLL